MRKSAKEKPLHFCQPRTLELRVDHLDHSGTTVPRWYEEYRRSLG